MARSKKLHHALTRDTFVGAVKLRCDEMNRTLGSLGRAIGMSPDAVRARLSKARGKRSLQPWQVSALAIELGMDVRQLHRLAAKHEGWDV